MSPKTGTNKVLTVFVATILLAQVAWAGDWPQWRHDPGRGAYSPEALPAELHLQWVRQLPKPQAAWPWNQYKQQFDASYEPVVAGKLIFVPSMMRDSVTAYDTETGREKWRFYADGPVRFAPAAWKNKLFFVSDDGHLYCLEAATGKFLWKFRGAPLQKRLLANWRLSSMYPARGAPAVYDGTVYFAAGVWPFMGTFIHALDADSGKVVWTNSGSGSVYILQPHSSPSFAGIAPQGYPVATSRHLVVPGGRTVPAGYDRKTGDLKWYHANTKRGHYTVWATDQFYWNDGLMGRLGDGAMVGGSGANIITDKAMIGLEGGNIVARAIALPTKKGKSMVPPPVVWQVQTGGAVDKIFIAAGNRVYGSKGGAVAAVEAGRGVTWQATVPGKVWNMLAGDDKLFVVTYEGGIYCFAGKKAEARKYVHAPSPPTSADPQWRAKARAAVKSVPLKESYCVVLGLGSGRLVEEIVNCSQLDLIVLEPDAAKVAAARRKYDNAGWYGKRLHILPGNLKGVQMPPYLASLVATEDARAAGLDDDGVLRKAFSMLRPYGGTLCVPGDGVRASGLKKRAESLALPNAEIAEAGGMVRLIRAGALPGSADWSHQYADISNSVFSPDKNPKAPLGVLWFGGPTNMDVLPRHGHGPTPQVVAGRLVIEGIGIMSARDVYTGRIIWRRELPWMNTFDMYYNGSYKPSPYDRSYNQGHIPGANWYGSNYVTTADKVYIISGPACYVLDAATGADVTQFKLPGEQGKQPNWGFVGVSGDLLVAAGSPVVVPMEKAAQGVLVDLKGYRPLIEKNAQWQYLGGAHPTGNWTEPGYKAAGWKAGQAGFGYTDNDDKTVLNDMKGRYAVLYCRKTFNIDNVEDVSSLAIGIRYDDGVIGYINGREVLRMSVAQGRGAGAKGVTSHEAGAYEHYKVRGIASLLRRGENVIAFEGHNRGANSSDFSLDPYLLVRMGAAAASARPAKPVDKIEGVQANARASWESRLLAVMDRQTGNVKWTRPATYAYRHNAIVAGKGLLFCLDNLAESRIEYLTRRGAKFPQPPTLYAMDIKTGRVVWKTDKNVFGTWLGYSQEYDVLLQGGSRAGDRGYDEVGAGMIAYKASTGDVLWQRSESYTGPPVLYHNVVITQTGGADRVAPPAPVYDIRTGKVATRKHPVTGRMIPLTWVRFKGCNTAVASENLLTFRSASAAFVPLDVSMGTATIGGFKSGCTSNLIVANGVLNAPDYTRTCTCAYQQQSSLAMVHMPELEYWGFDYFPPPRAPEPVQRAGVNFGAPGNRMADNATLWMEHPSIGGPSPDLPVRISGQNVGYFRGHNTLVEGDMSWVAASCVSGVTELKIRPFLQAEEAHKVVYGWVKIAGKSPHWAEGSIRGRFDKPRPYTVRLCFAELEGARAGQRVFSVSLQGKQVLKNFDIAAAAGGPARSVVREFKGIMITDDLVVSFNATRGQPVLSGVELVAE